MYQHYKGVKLLHNSKRWLSDGTFNAAPKPFKQVNKT